MLRFVVCFQRLVAESLFRFFFFSFSLEPSWIYTLRWEHGLLVQKVFLFHKAFSLEAQCCIDSFVNRCELLFLLLLLPLFFSFEKIRIEEMSTFFFDRRRDEYLSSKRKSSSAKFLNWFHPLYTNLQKQPGWADQSHQTSDSECVTFLLSSKQSFIHPIH